MDPVSIIGLVSVCVTSSASLYKTIDGFRTYKQDVRNLKSEVKELNIVLQALARNIQESTESFEVLDLVLRQCNQACIDFRKAVLERLGTSNGYVDDIKTWAKIQYLGSDISTFRNLIGSYKSTLTIALADSNLRTTKVTKQLLEEYIEMTKNTSSDLHEQISILTDKLQALRREKPNPSLAGQDAEEPSEMLEAKQTLDQKAGLEQCLTVCHRLLIHIDDAKSSLPEDSAEKTNTVGDPDASVNAVGSRVTADALSMCTHSLDIVMGHLQDLKKQKEPPSQSDEDGIVQHLNSARKCLDIISTAQHHRTSEYSNIIVAEDVFQTVVSTIGDLIKADGLTVGARSVNIMGQMNDESLQSMTSTLCPSVAQKYSAEEASNKFEKKHGYGYRMQAAQL